MTPFHFHHSTFNPLALADPLRGGEVGAILVFAALVIIALHDATTSKPTAPHRNSLTINKQNRMHCAGKVRKFARRAWLIFSSLWRK